MGFWDRIRGNSEQRALARVDTALEKAAHGAIKAGNDGGHDPEREPKGIHFDPFDVVAAMGYREKPYSMTYGYMDEIARRVPIIADIIATRINQVLLYCELPEGRGTTGLKVRHRDWRRNKTSKALEGRQQELEEILLHTGHYDRSRPASALRLRDFAHMMIHDSLTFDQACFEVVPDRRGRPSYLAPVDATTIRLLDPAMRTPDGPFAVQVLHGNIVAEFTRDELAFCVRHPQTAIRAFGYGCSEIETLTREITGILWGIDYNMRLFSQGTTAKGILNVRGLNDQQLSAFRRQWYAMLSGVTNAFRTPIISTQASSEAGVDWINFQLTSKDMEHSAWMDWLTKIGSARFQIDPSEVNFSYGNTNQARAMGGEGTEQKVKASKDRGLRPLVLWFFGVLNAHFLQRLDPDFEAVPVGLDEDGAEAEVALLKTQTEFVLTVDEARQQQGLPALGEGKGDVILNTTWIQWAQAAKAAEAANEEMATGEEPDDTADAFRLDDLVEGGAKPVDDDTAEVVKSMIAAVPERGTVRYMVEF